MTYKQILYYSPHDVFQPSLKQLHVYFHYNRETMIPNSGTQSVLTCSLGDFITIISKEHNPRKEGLL